MSHLVMCVCLQLHVRTSLAQVANTSAPLQLYVDESYTLIIPTTGMITIEAVTGACLCVWPDVIPH